MKYSAINIGPIITTLGMARKPRELWAASFLFSHLMKCIYAEAEKAKAIIISPAKPELDKNKVGIYPDRIYFKGEVDVKVVINEAMWQFYKDLHRDGEKKSKNPDLSYFNLMSASCEADKESDAIRTLNQELDVLELCNYATDGDAAQTIYEIISENKQSPLFDLADGKFIKNIKTIENISDIQRNVHPEIKEKSHHRYFCIVQADGDNVGKTVSHKDLKDGDVLAISQRLVQFGLNATQLIEDFGGLPIYAGGDDLLFIAPVIGKDGSNIFNLLDAIEKVAFKGVHDVVNDLDKKDDEGNKIEASLSFGVSISYYKYPLYEALETARNLLFGKAKNIKQKKAVAWSLRKHSGGTFEVAFSLKDEKLKKQFGDLIATTTDNDTVSAIAHKLRQEEALVDVVLESGDQDRLDALFNKVLEFDKERAEYFDSVKAIMPTLYNVIGKKGYVKALYSLLRTAKFIKGEDLHDE
jgi:CRISPR-associated protein Cmr2